MRVGIDIGNGDLVRLRSEGARELLVYGGEVLAVPAPWCVELDEGGLIAVEDNLVEGFRVEDRDGFRKCERKQRQEV